MREVESREEVIKWVVTGPNIDITILMNIS